MRVSTAKRNALCSLCLHLPRYLLLERPPAGTRPLASCTIFPTPDPKLGKGVLVQTTLWGNLILGPTARDVGNPQHDLTKDQCNNYILSKCQQLVSAFDPTHTFHAFAGAWSLQYHPHSFQFSASNTTSGARAKSSRKLPDGSDECDWIIEPCRTQVRAFPGIFRENSLTPSRTAAHDSCCRH